MFVSDENHNLHGQAVKIGCKIAETLLAISRLFFL
jgi:hypothetical protein